MRYFVLLIICLLHAPILNAQRSIRAKQYTTKDGLSQNSVNQILQDKQGYIWFATQDGLNRFNGYEFEVYRPNAEDSFAISDNFIIQMLEDQSGRLWLSTRNGINVFDQQTQRFHKILPRSLKGTQFYQINQHNNRIYFFSVIDQAMAVWSISEGSTWANAHLELERIAKIEHQDLSAFVAYFFRKDQLHLVTTDSVINTATKKVIPNETGTPIEIAAQNWNQFSQGSNVFLAERNSLTWLDFESEILKRKYRDHNTQCFLNDGTHLWIGTNKGIFQLDQNLNSKTLIEINSEPADKMIVHHMFQDHYGQIWIGTANNGVFCYNPQTEQFQYENITKNDEQNIVWHASDNGKDRLLGTDQGLILSGTSEFILKERITATLIDSNNTLWAGGANGDIWRIKESKVEKLPKKKTLSIVDFLEAHGKLYIATHSGLFEFQSGAVSYLSIGLEHHGTYLMALYLDRSNNLWVAHSGGVSYLKEDGSVVHLPYQQGNPKSINFNFSSGIAEDQNGAIWIATYGGGISNLGPDSLLRHYTEDDGLVNNVVHGMVSDRHGRFWLTSNGGISMFDPSEKMFRNYTMDNGLWSHNFAINSVTRLQNGQIGIGSGDGFLTFDPEKIAPFAVAPPLSLEGFQINYKSSRYSNGINQLEKIDLYNPDKVFSTSFIALKYDNPNDIMYSYQLEGFDEDWVSVSNNNRRISYSSLPFDQYTLKIRASSLNNHFDAVEKLLTIIVHPPFWLSWWFILFEVIVFLSVAFGIVYYFSRRKLKARLRELETRERVQAERERISRDLHDSVGTHFAYIVSRLDFLYLGWNKDAIKDKKDYLHNVTEFARSGMRMLRETIWALNEEHVNSTSLKAKIDDYLKLCFGQGEVQYTFDFTSDQEKIKASEALNSFRIIQESVSNSLKHAGATKVTIELSFTGGALCLKVCDNGTGFDLEEGKRKTDHYGMDNLNKRAKEMNAVLSIATSTDGTAISVSTNTP